MRFGDRFFGGILVRLGIGRIGGAAQRDARVVMGGAVEDRHRERMHERAERYFRALKQLGSQSQGAAKSQVFDINLLTLVEF
jgi:hypothetical protein